MGFLVGNPLESLKTANADKEETIRKRRKTLSLTYGRCQENSGCKSLNGRAFVAWAFSRLLLNGDSSADPTACGYTLLLRKMAIL